MSATEVNDTIAMEVNLIREITSAKKAIFQLCPEKYNTI